MLVTTNTFSRNKKTKHCMQVLRHVFESMCVLGGRNGSEGSKVAGRSFRSAIFSTPPSEMQ